LNIFYSNFKPGSRTAYIALYYETESFIRGFI